MMRALGVTAGSIALTSFVVGNAYYHKRQFYPSVVYITKSNPSMAVIYLQAFVLVVLTGKLMRKVFFGQLRAAEFEHLMERSWYAVTETCLAFTVFRDDFSPKFVALFTVLLFLKSFHWLADDRVDYMERSPVISWVFHIRALCLLVVLGSLDLHFVLGAYQSTVQRGASVQLVFGFEYAILLTGVLNIAIKYALHVADLHSEAPWEGKAVYLLYTELVMGFFKVVLYITFVIIMVRIYTLPLFAFRPMYLTMRAFRKAFNDVILSRRAIHNMNTLYPDATQEEITAADNVCIICREEMVTASKKLPCNHIFHSACLRSWFQRQQTCPTCRLNVLRAAPNNQQPQQQQQPPMQQHNHPQQHNAPMPGQAFPQQQPQQAQQQQQPQTAPLPGQQQPMTGGAYQPYWQPFPIPVAPTGDGQNQQIPPFVMPPFPYIPFGVPPPPPPVDLATLSESELRAMEGEGRAALEARITCLRSIQTLLDAAVAHMQQYSAVVAQQQQSLQQQRQASGQAETGAASSDGNSSETNQTNGTNGNEGEQDEIRRRRLERFAANNNNNES